MTAERWSGSFGDSYLQRTIDAPMLPRRGEFWHNFFLKYPVKSVLEIGAGAGANLRWLKANRICGVDINANALAVARTLPNVDVALAEATHVPYSDDSFELVFTCGLLIHLPENKLGGALDEMYRLTLRLLLVMEYQSVTAHEIEYRGECGLLWKRPYDQIVKQRYSQLTLIDEGFLGHDDGFDDLNWSLFSK